MTVIKENDPESIIQNLLRKNSVTDISLLDGYKFDYPGRRFTLKKSGMNPLVIQQFRKINFLAIY